MAEFQLRTMRADEWSAVSEVICSSIRAWYAAAGKPGRFPGGPASCMLFPQVYEAIDPGCCIVAEETATGRLAGSCFYHPRESHISLGIMNAHPDFFGHGVAKMLLQHICDLADRAGKPVRLVSSAMNLDSFSLYTRAGFSARAVFHTMSLSVPADGLAQSTPELARVRPATLRNIDAMAKLEWDVAGIRRENDFRYLIENRKGIWHVSVIESTSGPGTLDGFLVSVTHPASEILGPGVMRTQSAAAALILAELNHHRGSSPTFLIPTTSGQLVRQLYQWGARNSEIHLFQVRGQAQPFNGIVMPTFMPETG